MNLQVELPGRKQSLLLPNPIMTASGTFSFGLETVHGCTVQDLALEVLEISRQGLRIRARLDGGGTDESPFLDTLFETAESGRTPAEELLEAYETPWGGSVDPVFKEFAS